MSRGISRPATAGAIIAALVATFHATGVHAQGCRPIVQGEWKVSTQMRTAKYSASCPFITPPVSCSRNGESPPPQNWVWTPPCGSLPFFKPQDFLKLAANKTVLFVGDSVMVHNFFPSIACMIHSYRPLSKPRKTSPGVYQELYEGKSNVRLVSAVAPYLVKYEDVALPVGNVTQGFKVVTVDIVGNWTKLLPQANILVMSSGAWWRKANNVFTRSHKILGENLSVTAAYQIAMTTVRTYVQTKFTGTAIYVAPAGQLNPTRKKPANMRQYGACGFSAPASLASVRKDNYTALVEALGQIERRMFNRPNVRIRLLDIQPSSLLRPDTLVGWHSGNAKQVVDDCTHFCLPGLPDTWSDMFLAFLKQLLPQIPRFPMQ